MDIQFLLKAPLFQGTNEAELLSLLAAVGASEGRFRRGEVIVQAGEPTNRLYLVLSGGVTVENHDAWGNRTILGHAAPGEVFAETYACLPGQPMMVSAVASRETALLSLNAAALLEGSAPGNGVILKNLLRISAEKNLALSRRSFYTSSKTIRGRVMSYLSDQAVLYGSLTFSIPFDRQQLADYLGVDRSALSNELSKLRREGLLTARKNRFTLLTQGQTV